MYMINVEQIRELQQRAETLGRCINIDAKRAEAAADRAKEVIAKKDASDADVRMAQARLKRALVRSSVARPM